MRVAIIGPTYPYKGGIAHHTTELAHRLQAAGHETEVFSWSEQYPDWLYPGVQRAADDHPGTPAFPATSYPLSWKNPLGWLGLGKRLRRFDRVILVVVTSFQAPAYLTLLGALGGAGRQRCVALCHNVLPHERRFFDVPLTRAVLQRAGRVLVHTEAQAQLARELGARQVVSADMPPHLPAQPPASLGPQGGPSKRHLLFFGLVRPYKGVDVLLRALARVPALSLTVAGEIWGGVEPYRALIGELGLGGRVTLESGYVPSQRIGELFAASDALVLPYRNGTATQNVQLAHAHGCPVIATRVGSLPAQVRDGVDGLLCTADDVDDLERALRRFYEPGVAESLRQNVPAVSSDAEWARYLPRLLEGSAH
ncbi:MAG: glycosyltransferase family 4 protein [Polyangiaceae bacterium]